MRRRESERGGGREGGSTVSVVFTPTWLSTLGALAKLLVKIASNEVAIEIDKDPRFRSKLLPDAFSAFSPPSESPREVLEFYVTCRSFCLVRNCGPIGAQRPFRDFLSFPYNTVDTLFSGNLLLCFIFKGTSPRFYFKLSCTGSSRDSIVD